MAVVVSCRRDGPRWSLLLRYLPYAVFCFMSPGLSLLYGFTGFKIEKVEPVAPDQSPGRE
jgi:Na+/H+ antiporter NhaC